MSTSPAPSSPAPNKPLRASAKPLPRDQHDVVVIGAGFGGLATALRLAEQGVDVALCENLKYPGGCASTFERQGARFEAGATLFSGFAPGQPFAQWIERHKMDVQIDWIDPIVEMRAPGLHLDVPRQRQTLIDRFCEMPGAPQQALRAFFDHQRRVADALWELFADPALLPPFKMGAFFEHVRRSPRYLPLLSLVGRPLGKVLERHGLTDFEPLRIYLDALCQITVQASAAQAEAPFALAATDYFFRGTGHVRGGIGQLATAMVKAIKDCGGHVYMPNRVRGMKRTAEGWALDTRRGPIKARKVVANLLPQDLRALLQTHSEERFAALDKLSERVEGGWGAAMLYLTIAPSAHAPDAACHLEMVIDPKAPFIEGNHLFCSVSGAHEERTDQGMRTATVSTHVPIQKLYAMDDDAQSQYIDRIHQSMRQGLQAMAPEWITGHIQSEMTASPRTFARFTRRHLGCVGGIPRQYGLAHYRQLTPFEPANGVFMVGDSVFPGQSTLATAIGGIKVADTIAKSL